MSWRQRVRGIKVGDTVVYSRPFLQSISCYSGDIPQAKGKVMALRELSDHTILAEIEWDRHEMPAKVNLKNLSKVNSHSHGIHD